MDHKKCRRCRKNFASEGISTCGDCREKQKEYMSQRRVLLSIAGICQQCYVEASKKGGIYCQSCLDVQKAKRTQKTSLKVCVFCSNETNAGTVCVNCRERSRVAALSRRRKWKQEGKCVKCGEDKDDKKYAKCDKCRKLASDSYKRAKERVVDGWCLDCGRSACIEGNSRCEDCYFKRVAIKRVGSVGRWQDIKQLFSDQNGVCPYTGQKLKIGLNTELDHKVPKDKGGTNDITNLQWVYSIANTMKWNSDEQEFLRVVKMIYEHRIQT